MLKKFLPLAVVGLLAGCNGGSDETAAEFDYPAEFALPAVNENLDQTSPEGVWMITAKENSSFTGNGEVDKSKSRVVALFALTADGDNYTSRFCNLFNENMDNFTFVADGTDYIFTDDRCKGNCDNLEHQELKLTFSADNLQLTGTGMTDWKEFAEYVTDGDYSNPLYVEHNQYSIQGVKISDAQSISDEELGENMIRANFKVAGSMVADTDNGSLGCFALRRENLAVERQGKTSMHTSEMFLMGFSRFETDMFVQAYRFDLAQSLYFYESSGHESATFDNDAQEDYPESVSEDVTLNYSAINATTVGASMSATNANNDSMEVSFSFAISQPSASSEVVVEK